MMDLQFPLLQNWTPELSARMGNAIVVAQHRLHELDLFGDEQLIELLDKHPRAHLGISSMGSDPVRREDWCEGRAGDLNADQLLDAVKHGLLWLNMQRMMDFHLDINKLVNSVYAELESVCPGLQTFNRSANLLISSPKAIAYYHVDSSLSMLWHLRGAKRVWAYPLESGIVSDSDLEAILCGDISDQFDFNPEMDDLAVVQDVVPGEMITWPQHTPHRVVNMGGLNVSLATEHMTRQALRKNNVYMANRHFRSLLPGDFRSTELHGWRPAWKELALRVSRRLPGIAPKPLQRYEYPVKFEIDLDAPQCIRSCRSTGFSLLGGETPLEGSIAVAEAR